MLGSYIGCASKMRAVRICERMDWLRTARDSTIAPSTRSGCSHSMAQNHRFLDATWRRWLKENLERGCSLEQLVEILHKNGFADASIQEAIASFNKEAKPL